MMDYFDAFELGHKIGFGLIKRVLCVIVLIGLKIYFRFNFNTDRFQHVNHLLKCSSSETLKRPIFWLFPLTRVWLLVQILECHPITEYEVFMEMSPSNSCCKLVSCHCKTSTVLLWLSQKKKSNSLISKFMVRFSLPLLFLQLHLQ